MFPGIIMIAQHGVFASWIIDVTVPLTKQHH